MKKGDDGVQWSEEELQTKKDSLINSKKYDTAQQSILKRFSTTVYLNMEVMN